MWRRKLKKKSLCQFEFISFFFGKFLLYISGSACPLGVCHALQEACRLRQGLGGGMTGACPVRAARSQDVRACDRGGKIGNFWMKESCVFHGPLMQMFAAYDAGYCILNRIKDLHQIQGNPGFLDMF